MARGNFRLYPALTRSSCSITAPHGPSKLVKIAATEQSLEETRA